MNHVFIRELKEYPDFLEDGNDDDDNGDEPTVDYLEIFFSDPNNIIIITTIGIIVIGTGLSIWIIHKRRVQKNYEEFKKLKRRELIHKNEDTSHTKKKKMI